MLPYQDPSKTIDVRVEDLLSRMTDEEKVAQLDMIRGVELADRAHPVHFCSIDPDADFHWDRVEAAIGERGFGFVHDVYSHARVLNLLQRYFVEKTRLGIPCIFTGEALHGISYPGATSFPMPIALGATFDPDVVHEIGHAIGKESRTLGIAEILAPNLDLAREPRWGRVEETFGEDTHLSSQMAYAIITGEQNHGDLQSHEAVVCEPKHYVGHGVPEGGINCSPLHAGPREVETFYLPVFEAGVKRAGAYCAMAAYHSIDGEPVVTSSHYLRDVLKGRMGMRGYVRADFGAVARLNYTHHMTAGTKQSIAMAVNAGLDVQGFDYANADWQGGLLENLADASISRDVLDEAVRRVLRVKFELGLFENPYLPEGREEQILRCDAHKALSLQAAREAVTLLQNKNGILPLRKDAKIALLGPSSAVGRLGGYSSVPYGYRVPTMLDELTERGATFRQCAGCGITEQDVDAIPMEWYPDGVEMEYYSATDFGGELVGRDTARQVNFTWILAKPHRDLPFNNYSVRMHTDLCPDTRATFGADSFDGYLIFTGNDEVRVWLDGELIIDGRSDGGKSMPRAQVHFDHGVRRHIDVELRNIGACYNLTLSLDNRSDSMEEAVSIARESDVAVIVCGDDKCTSGEGMDRSDMKLYGRQQELIRRVAETGTPIVLVLENGKPLDLSDEVGLCDGILETWFIGEHGAKAIAEVLFGERSPAGRLPISFPRSVGALPCYYNRFPGGSDRYMEDSRAALFPFGHGLSYTNFTYGEMRVERTGRYDVTVTADITNEGDMDADEVVQLYIRDVVTSVITPDCQLAAFRRVHIPAKATRSVTLTLGFDAFRLLDRHMEWVVEPGEFLLMLGASSTDVRRTATVTLD